MMSAPTSPLDRHVDSLAGGVALLETSLFAVRRFAPVLALLLLCLAWSGQLVGWRAVWQSLAEGGGADAPRSIAERAAALDVNPLSRKSRIALAETVDNAFSNLGADRIAALAPQSTLGRAVMADVLDRRGAVQAAVLLRTAIGDTRPEELEAFPDAMLRQVALDAAIGGRCREALPLFDEAARRGLSDGRMGLKYAGCLNATGDGRRALEVLLPMQERNPNSRWIRLFIAEAEARLGYLETSGKLTSALAQSEPRFYEAFRFGGALLVTMGYPKEAARAYRRALLLRPENKWLQWDIWKLEKAARTASAPGATPPTAPAAPPTAER